MNNIAAYILDLDNTIYSTEGRNAKVIEPVIEAIAKANNGKLDQENLEKALQECYKYPIWDIAERYGFSDEMLKAAIGAYENLEINGKLEIFPDFEAVKKMKGLKFLVTSGIENSQMKKVQALDIGQVFDEIFIDTNRDKKKPGKKEIFEKIVRKYALEPSQVVVIGDNPHSELKAGKDLNMCTVLMARNGEKPEHADYVIGSFYQLEQVLAGNQM